MDIKTEIENIVASACDSTLNGLDGAYFPEHNNPPQKLADKLVAYVESLMKQQERRCTCKDDNHASWCPEF